MFKVLYLVAFLSVIGLNQINCELFEIGERQDGDQFLESDCDVTGLTDLGEIHFVEFNKPGMNITYAELRINPEWHWVSHTDDYSTIGVGMGNSTQISVTCNFFGFPTKRTGTDINNNAKKMNTITRKSWN